MVNMQDKCIRLYRYFKFLKVSVFIMVLITIHAWLENSIATILITHLTGDGLKLPKAASIVNVQDGISAFLLLFVAYVSDTKMGSFRTVVFTTTVYLIGLVLIFVMARKENINISFLFVAAIFIALGRSGRDISLKQFLADQCKEEWSLNDDEEDRIESRREIYWRIASVLGVVISICVSWIYKDMELVVLCKISAIAIGVALAFFLAGIPFYHVISSPDKNSQSVASQLLLAALKKKHLNRTCSSAPSSSNRHIYMDTALRWVDKAAIIEPSLSVEEQIRRGRLYTAEQVMDVKKMISMIPLWTTFLVYGLLQATASVFFYEQVDYMDPHIGRISNVPVVIFAVIIQFTSFGVSYICGSRLESYWGDKVPRHAMLVRIGAGLAIAPICCVISWRVESYRLEKYVKSDISINIVWLIPQFVLLGVLEGLVSEGMEKFFYASVSTSFRKYGPSFTQFAPNIGHFISLALVLNLRSLFGDSLDTSSLGLYYAILGYVCFVNFMFYCFVASHFVKRHQGEEFAQDEERADQVMEELQITGQVMEEIQKEEDIINPDADVDNQGKTE